jgi:hypothetical protein
MDALEQPVGVVEYVDAFFKQLDSSLISEGNADLVMPGDSPSLHFGNINNVFFDSYIPLVIKIII